MNYLATIPPEIRIFSCLNFGPVTDGQTYARQLLMRVRSGGVHVRMKNTGDHITTFAPHDVTLVPRQTDRK